MLATSGVLLQAVLKNPLADPGIVGISAGGLVACALVYAFAWQKGFQPKRIILVGIAINAFFEALGEEVSYTYIC